MNKTFRAAIAVLGATMLLAGCTPSKPIVAIALFDRSESAVSDEKFAKLSQESCHTFASNLHPDDSAGHITVDGKVPKAYDLAQVQDPRKFHKNCQQSSSNMALASVPKGTFSCPAWDEAFAMSHRQAAASLPVLYVSVIQTNERETACPKIWRKLADDVEKRGGKLVIAGSSVGDAQNPALDGSFNKHLWQYLKDYPNTVFCEENNIRGCIEQAVIDIRNSPTGTQQ
jgi:hypothetical protein